MTFRRPQPRTREETIAARQKPSESVAVSLHRGVMGGSVRQLTKPAPVKTVDKKRQSIRDSARGEECLVRLPGCPNDPAMTIWSHYRGADGGKGMGTKAIDVAGAYACTYCDAIYDGQRPRPAGMTKEAVDMAWMQGHIRSLERLVQKGLLR